MPNSAPDTALRTPVQVQAGPRLGRSGRQAHEILAEGPLQQAVWPVGDNVTLLNHGSYGVTPEYVRARQDELRDVLDRDPPRFFVVELERLADTARQALAAFVNCPPKDLTFVGNGTYAVAAAIRSYEPELEPGDEIVVTDHEYKATFNELTRLCARTGAVVKTARVPLPVCGPHVVAEAVEELLTDRTRFVVISHITSASSLIFPVERIVESCKARGIGTIIDGAHTPGQIPLDIAALDPTFYVASCHKWLCTPKGTGFVYCTPERQAHVRPAAESCRVHHNRPDRSHFLADFDYVGTGDYTGNLVVHHAIEHLGAQLPGGWDELYRRNHDVAVAGARAIRETCGLPQTCPDDMVGTMYSLLLPANPSPRPMTECEFEETLWDAIYANHAIQVPVWGFDPVWTRVMRVSAHLHNTPPQFELLADALRTELKREARG
ncbi:MAG: aminotransferase class V-fold PLP-dependent enzyme [Planctomycetota bacterium]